MLSRRLPEPTARPFHEPPPGLLVQPALAPTRADRRMAEAQALASSHVAELQAVLDVLKGLAAEVAQGGAAYPVGVRAVCERLAEEADGRARQLHGVLFRQSQAAPRSINAAA